MTGSVTGSVPGSVTGPFIHLSQLGVKIKQSSLTVDVGSSRNGEADVIAERSSRGGFGVGRGREGLVDTGGTASGLSRADPAVDADL